MLAEKGKRVKVHYTGTLTDGTVFDSSRDREPLEFVLGAGQMIPGFDKGVEGMKVGEEKSLRLSPEDAYGERNDNLLFRVSSEALPEGYTPQEGDMLQVTTDKGFPMRVTVAEIAEEYLMLDGNHQLAGQELLFTVELVEVNENQ
ncbi:MAG TPA: peptidylprolyl isomerase [Synergistaceae bacterium]|nr:peptidylprolyl isomerase [Synergistaceae bacterium]HPJ25571.1 peptidylprolyl isomerase [Synergistaceae bacterium]HPQ36496.1 peptidylprolyl isomerase [Synergistaceae bacterium]